MNLRTGNSGFYGVFDEIDVATVLSPFCLSVKRMHVVPCTKRLPVSFTHFTRLYKKLMRI